MHELSLTRNIVALCSEHAGGRRVRRVTLEIGTLSCVLPDALRFCYGLCTDGTLLAGSTLDIVRVDARGRCRNCGAERALPLYGAQCACGARDFEILAGEELKVRDMELEDGDAAVASP